MYVHFYHQGKKGECFRCIHRKNNNHLCDMTVTTGPKQITQGTDKRRYIYVFKTNGPVPQEAADIDLSDLIEMHRHVHLGLDVCVAQSAAHFGNTVATGRMWTQFQKERFWYCNLCENVLCIGRLNWSHQNRF